MVILTAIILGVLALALYALRVFALQFAEFEDGFVYFTVGVMILIVGTAIYLSYATPTFAGKNTLRGTQATVVEIDTSNLLSE